MPRGRNMRLLRTEGISAVAAALFVCAIWRGWGWGGGHVYILAGKARAEESFRGASEGTEHSGAGKGWFNVVERSVSLQGGDTTHQRLNPIAYLDGATRDEIEHLKNKLTHVGKGSTAQGDLIPHTRTRRRASSSQREQLQASYLFSPGKGLVGRDDGGGWFSSVARRVGLESGQGLFPHEIESPAAYLDRTTKDEIQTLKDRLLRLGLETAPTHDLSPSPFSDYITHTQMRAPVLNTHPDKNQSVLCYVPILAEWFEESLGCAAGAGFPLEEGEEPSGELWERGVRGLGWLRRLQSGSFPNEERSPAAGVDRSVQNGVRDFEEHLNGLGSEGAPRGGLKAVGDAHEKASKEATNSSTGLSALCGLPLVSDAFDLGCDRSRADQSFRVRHRPLMIPAGVDRAQQRREREEYDKMRRILRGEQAVESAESKMGRYYGAKPIVRFNDGGYFGFHLRQPHDVIVPAESGQSEEENSRRLKKLMDAFAGIPGELKRYVPDDMLPENWHSWFDRWNSSARPGVAEDVTCAEDDPTCGSTLTLHDPRLTEPVDPIAPGYFPSIFRGSPIPTPPQGPVGHIVPCLNPPTCSAAPVLGEVKKRREERQRELFYAFPGIGGGPILPGESKGPGERVRCLHPFCGAPHVGSGEAQEGNAKNAPNKKNERNAENAENSNKHDEGGSRSDSDIPPPPRKGLSLWPHITKNPLFPDDHLERGVLTPWMYKAIRGGQTLHILTTHHEIHRRLLKGDTEGHDDIPELKAAKVNRGGDAAVEQLEGWISADAAIQS